LIILKSIWRFILEKVTYWNRLIFQNQHFNLKYYIQGYQIQILEISSFFVTNQEFIRSYFFRNQEKNQEIFLWDLRDIHWFLWDTVQLFVRICIFLVWICQLTSLNALFWTKKCILQAIHHIILFDQFYIPVKM
jgi:hypothetical protein